MHQQGPLARGLAFVVIASLALSAPLGADGAGASQTVPRPIPAYEAAEWLGGLILPGGYLPNSTGVGHPDYSASAQAVLALAAAEVDLPQATHTLEFLEANVATYLTATGAIGPSQASLLILDAVALGFDPRSFGGVNLVDSLLGTEQLSGPDTGLFGTTEQLADYSAGTYQQGLALGALSAAGLHSTAPVIAAATWLARQQCPDGGWSLPDATLDPCTGSPSTWQGPDTNSTALAVEGLLAQGALSDVERARTVAFFEFGLQPNGGWSYYPATPNTSPGADPDSSALVIEALSALDVSAQTSRFVASGVAPVTALLSFSLSDGALTYPGSTTAPNLIATYEAIPALEGLAIPFAPPSGSYSLVGADGSLYPFGDARFFGSLPGLGVEVDDVVSTFASPDGAGYTMVGRDGGVFSFGDARYVGSLPALGIGVDDVVAAVSTPDGGGYWLIGRDGGVFAFGDARYVGSLPALGIGVDDVVGVAASGDGDGYWLVGADGGVFAFGDARYAGSLPALGISIATVVAITPNPGEDGYYLASRSGGVFSFGGGSFLGSLAGSAVNDVVGLLVTASTPR